jgi:ketosteroid isomerase-like protein
MNKSLKHTCVIALVLCLLLVQTAGAAGSDRLATDAKRELMNFEKGWWEAFANRDKVALEHMLAEDFLGFDFGTDHPKTKDQWIASATDKDFHVDSYAIERMDVLISGDTAVVAVHYLAHYTNHGKKSHERAIDLDTLVRRDGHWQALATGEIDASPGTPAPSK